MKMNPQTTEDREAIRSVIEAATRLARRLAKEKGMKVLSPEWEVHADFAESEEIVEFKKKNERGAEEWFRQGTL